MDHGQPSLIRKRKRGKQVHRLLIFRFALCLAAAVSLDPVGAQVFSEETFTQRQRAEKKRAIAISAVLPGLGQVALGSRVKGLGIFLGELTTLVVAVNANENYKTLRGRHEQETERYLALREGGRFEQAEQRWQTLKGMEDDLDSYHKWRQLAYLSAGIYVYNMVDILFFAAPGSGARQARHTAPEGLQLSARMIDGSPGVGIAWHGL